LARTQAAVSRKEATKYFEKFRTLSRSVERLDKELATLGEEMPPAELSPAKRKKQSPDPTKRDASKVKFGRRALAGGNMWDSLSCLLTLLESFDKNQSRDGDGQCGKTDASKDGAALLGQPI